MVTQITADGIVVGVDTHQDIHVAVAIDGLGRRLATATFTATAAGHTRLINWAQRHGRVDAAGVEGTGSYGAGLARTLTDHGWRVIDVDRPDRKTRRANGKSDTIDAEAAARAVLAGTATTIPKARHGQIEAIRALYVAYRGAVKARTQTANQLHSLILTAPQPLREQLGTTASIPRIRRCARLRPTSVADPINACRHALRSLARRWLTLTDETTDLRSHLDTLTTAAAPTLRAAFGVGTDTAAQLLITAGDNPDRLHSDAAFAHLCGAAPIPASSGRTHRHRLNRGGDRQANRALHTVALVRHSQPAGHPATAAYIAKRTAQGRTHREIMRCLKRAIAREIYTHIRHDLLDTA